MRTWIARGRQAAPAGDRAKLAPFWDMLEIRGRSRMEQPEAWVPDLAVVLERYKENPDASSTIVYTLLEMGLVQTVPNPDDPNRLLLDTQMLRAVMVAYGPRVTTAGGELGVSASRGQLWTPGGSSGGGGGIWTPGSETGGASGSEGKPKLIIPGR
jgi:hypothetical protein